MIIYYFTRDGTLTSSLARYEYNHYFLISDGVTVSKYALDNDGVHFSTEEAALSAK